MSLNKKISNNVLHVISIDKRVNDYLVDTIRQVIGHKVKVEGFCVDEELVGPRKAPLVITSGKFLKNKIEKIYPDSKIISAKRTINGYNLEKIINLPKGKKVLVINHPKATTDETIESLKEMGIDHLEYVSYWKGKEVDFSDIDTVISPGMIHLCPPGFKNRIDIGQRSIGFSTFMEILSHFSLEPQYMDQFANEYIKVIVNTEHALSDALGKADVLKMSLQTIINEMDEAIVSINAKGEITQFNAAAEKLFNLSKEVVMDQPFHIIFNDLKEEEKGIFNHYENDKRFVQYNNRRLIRSYIPLSTDSGEVGIFTFKEIEEIQRIEEGIRRFYHNKGYVAKYTFDQIIGKSPCIEAAIKKAKKISSSNSTVLINGESGTGKEIFAQAIHNASSRKTQPFVAINFAALPENLVESELFGYEEGAFTGAKRGGKKGLFEEAHGGTIFLDEIGDASLGVQTRLLRVLQEKEIMKVGASKIIPINVRVIAATNKDLKELVIKGTFREDLYYRLKVLPIQIPPLRERKEDVLEFVRSFMIENNCHKAISTDAENYLMQYSWPGNIRELQNVVEYFTQISEGNVIEKEDCPPDLGDIKSKEEEWDQEYIMIRNKISNFINIKEVEFILEKLDEYNCKGIRIGRQRLADEAKSQGFLLTEEKIRKILKHLEELGLVLSGKTKQGTIVTDKGIRILGSIR